jgi:hypothetical protein
MKNILNKILLSLYATSIISISLFAQNSPASKEKVEVTIGLSYFKRNDTSKTIVAIVKKREDGKFVFAKYSRVNFYVVNNKEQQLLKTVTTNNHGQAVLPLRQDLPLDDSLYFTLLAKVENNPLFEDATEQVHLKDANLTLQLNAHDTGRVVTARVTEKGKDGKEIPVKAAELKFYVKRLFGFMPASEGNTVVTDDNGEASFSFPKNIPGDTSGGIFVAARMEDNEKFGNLENKAAEPWGTALQIDKDPFPRALFEPHAPLPLVITISTLFGGVWLIYIYIAYQLRKIKKEGQLAAPKAVP